MRDLLLSEKLKAENNPRALFSDILAVDYYSVLL
jgi:hypothetical protein